MLTMVDKLYALPYNRLLKIIESCVSQAHNPVGCIVKKRYNGYIGIQSNGWYWVQWFILGTMVDIGHNG